MGMIKLEEIQATILSLVDEHIQFITIFGSRARGTEHEQSDTDIAILTNVEDSLTRSQLRLRLIAALSGPEKRVDIVTTEDADWELRYRIARDGKVLLNRNDSWEEFVESVIKYYPDYHIFFSNLLEQSLKRV